MNFVSLASPILTKSRLGLSPWDKSASRYPAMRASTVGAEFGRAKKAMRFAPAFIRYSVARKPVRRLKAGANRDRKSTRLNSSHQIISYAVFCLKKKKKKT